MIVNLRLPFQNAIDSFHIAEEVRREHLDDRSGALANSQDAAIKVIGAAIVMMFAPETRGVTLEELGAVAAD